MTIASSVWLTNVVAAGMGKSTPFPYRTSGVTYKRDIYFTRHLAGELAVPNTLDHLILSISSSAPAGTL